jgi:transposase InsO family protein
VKFAFIEAELSGAYPLDACCDALGVSRAGYYAWRRRPRSARAARRAELAAKVRAVHAANRRVYGSPRVHAALRAEGRRVGVNRVARLMRRHGIQGRRKRRAPRTTDSKHALPIAPNLLDRRFTAAAPNRVWLADITCIPTNEGWLYLAVVLDLFSRRVVGWSMRETMPQELTITALRMAITNRRPGPGLVHHADRGSQYAARAYRRLLDESGMLCSMNRKGDC